MHSVIVCQTHVMVATPIGKQIITCTCTVMTCTNDSIIDNAELTADVKI